MKLQRNKANASIIEAFIFLELGYEKEYYNDYLNNYNININSIEFYL